MHSPSLPIHLAHLENIDPAFLDPNTGFVVMPEAVALGVDEARLALDGLAWILDSGTELNRCRRETGRNVEFLQVPHDSLAAIMRLIAERLRPACDNPTLNGLKKVRPDLF